MRKIIRVTTTARQELVDITKDVEAAVNHAKIQDGIACLYAQGATAAIMVQENWDDSIRTDVINCLSKLAPEGVWLHDRQDGNGDAHIKAGIVGPSETIPIIAGNLGLSTWQNIFLCDFDGPREKRDVIVTIIADQTK